MSIQNLYPNIDPTLLLDFANVKALDPRITYARASAATYYGTETAKAEENLLRRSQAWATTPWFQNIGGSVTAVNNAATAPNETTTATSLTFSAQFGSQAQSVTTISGLSYTFSFFAKRISGNTALHINHFLSATGANTAFTITNDWVRYSVTVLGRSGGGDVQFGIQDRNASGFGEIQVWGAQLEQRDSATNYTPTTTQPITNFVPVLESAAAGEARFDHNPVTGESLGLLIEESRTNLILRSEEFDNAGWSKVNGTVTTNTIVAPDGTLTGDKLIANTVSAQHRLDQTPVSSAGAQTFSVYAKAGGYNFVGLRVGSSGSSFNLSTEDVSVNSAGSVGSIQSVGNGWYRCSIVVAAASANDIARINITEASSPSVSFVGDGFSGIFIWGASIEQGAFPTSYVKTTTAQVTRAADAASMTGANFSSWYRQDEGSLYSESSRPFPVPSGGVARGFEINDGTVNNRLINSYHNATTALFFVGANGSTQANISLTTSAVGRKLASAYQLNNFAASVNGGTVGTSATGILPVVTQAQIGSSGSTTLNGHIRKLSFYPKRLSNAELQSLTG